MQVCLDRVVARHATSSWTRLSDRVPCRNGQPVGPRLWAGSNGFESLHGAREVQGRADGQGLGEQRTQSRVRVALATRPGLDSHVLLGFSFGGSECSFRVLASARDVGCSGAHSGSAARSGTPHARSPPAPLALRTALRLKRGAFGVARLAVASDAACAVAAVAGDRPAALSPRRSGRSTRQLIVVALFISARA